MITTHGDLNFYGLTMPLTTSSTNPHSICLNCFRSLKKMRNNNVKLPKEVTVLASHGAWEGGFILDCIFINDYLFLSPGSLQQKELS